jgi:hypothetical protein
VMIDSDYDGEVLKVVLCGIPASKHDFVEGSYELPMPNSEGPATVAVKITDMLGEEVQVARTLNATQDKG